jgi:hypothetical protein
MELHFFKNRLQLFLHSACISCKVDFEGFLELLASPGVVALPCLFMGHHLVHLG